MSNNDEQSLKPTEMESDKVRKEDEDGVPLPSSVDASSDYSDVLPPGDDQSSPKRRHQRGGRKKKSEGNLESTSEGRIPWSERNGRLKPEYGSQVDQQDEADEAPVSQNDGEDSDLERTARSSPEPRPKAEQASPDGKSKAFETGVRAFNLKKAESSGGRPFGLSVEQPKSKGKSKKKEKEKKKKKPKKTRSHSSDESEEEDDEDEEEEPRKPLSIRLDLNLELEIFLRAKVKGDITITFLSVSRIRPFSTKWRLTFHRE
jgi:hypothetical protein